MGNKLVIGAWEAVWVQITGDILNFMTFLLKSSIGVSLDFWNQSIITGLVSFSAWVNRLTFAGAFVVMLFDIVEDIAADKPVKTNTVFSNIVKAFAFIEGAPLLGRYSMQFMDELIKRLNFSTDIDGIYVQLESALETFIIVGMLIAIIACGVFLFQSLRCFGFMFVQILTAFLYLPGIIRGDTTAMGGWIRQTLAIALSFFFKYLCFYLGLTFLLTGGIFFSIAFWAVMGATDKILDKFGWSYKSGANVSSTAHMLMQFKQLVAS